MLSAFNKQRDSFVIHWGRNKWIVFSPGIQYFLFTFVKSKIEEVSVWRIYDLLYICTLAKLQEHSLIGIVERCVNFLQYEILCMIILFYKMSSYFMIYILINIFRYRTFRFMYLCHMNPHRPEYSVWFGLVGFFWK